MAGDLKVPHIPGAASVYWDGRGYVTAVFKDTAPDGTKIRKPIRAKTPAALKRKARDFLSKWEASGVFPGSSPTLEQWMNYWLDNIAAADVRPKTLSNYRSLTKNHIVKHAGNVRLDQVSTATIRGLNAKVQKATSSTTALTVHRILSSALTAAERDGKIAKNHSRNVKPPRRDIPNIQPLTVDEAGKLIETFRASEQAYLWATYLLTGARRGEILGLQWDRVTDVLDLEWQLQRHTVGMNPPVDYEYQSLGGGLYLTRPKSKAGVRIVPLVEPLRGILDAWRTVAPSNAHDLVFTTAAGKPIDPDEATRAWHSALKAAGITRRVRLHDARHTAIDLMIEGGVEEDIIREIVGHSTLMMTRAYRSKSTRKRLTQGLEPFSTLFSKPDEPDTPPAIGA